MRTDNRLKKYVLSAVLVLALMATAAVWAGGGGDSVAADTYVVSNGDDSGPGSLRNVIANAAAGDTIAFSLGVTTITLQSEISFDKPNITIDGKGIVTITKSAAGNFRLLNSTATSGTLTLKGLTFSNGLVTGGDGGGVFASGSVTITNCTFIDNKSDRSGGGVYATNATMTGCTFAGNTADRDGGGVRAFKATLANCTFTGNTADIDGGGLYSNGSSTLIGCTFADNTAGRDGGGADLADSTLIGCTFTNNRANSGGGAVAFGNTGLTGCKFAGNTAAAYGGGFYASKVEKISECLFTGNTAGRDGGGAYVNDYSEVIGCAFEGNAAGRDGGGMVAKSILVSGCTFAGNTASGNGGGMTAKDSVYEMNECAFVGNTAGGSGGAAYVGDDVNMVGDMFSGNTAGGSGGMYVENAASMNRCTFVGNTAVGNGGAMHAGNANVTGCKFTGNKAGSGGGMAISANVDLTDCKFTSNTATNGGGGVYVWGGAALTNSAFFGNTAGSGGGAVYLRADLAFSIGIMSNCTISSNATDGPGNSAVFCDTKVYIFHCTVTDNAGGGIYAYSGASARLYNSIVAGNTLSQTSGPGTIDLSYGNLVEGENIPGSLPAAVVTYARIFGSNAFDPATGVHRILNNGIAAYAATKITDANLAAAAPDLDPSQRAAVLDGIDKDQTGAVRPSGKVTYGAAEVLFMSYVPLWWGIIAAVVIIGLIAAAAVLHKKSKPAKKV